MAKGKLEFELERAEAAARPTACASSSRRPPRRRSSSRSSSRRAASVDIVKKYKYSVAVADDQLYWPYEGEYWRDELGTYQYTLTKGCIERDTANRTARPARRLMRPEEVPVRRGGTDRGHQGMDPSRRLASKSVTIAFDVMGSDQGPRRWCGGRRSSRWRRRTSTRSLVGDAQVIDAALAETEPQRPSASPSSTPPSSCCMDEKPGEALARKPDASVLGGGAAGGRGRGGRAGLRRQHGRGRAGVRAALQAAPGVRRAALAAVYPTRGRAARRRIPFSLILDVGATVEATAEDLVAFAVMGAAYARIISRERPAPRWRCSPTAPSRRRARRGWWRRTRSCPRMAGMQLHRQRGGRGHPQGHRGRHRHATASWATCA